MPVVVAASAYSDFGTEDDSAACIAVLLVPRMPETAVASAGERLSAVRQAAAAASIAGTEDDLVADIVVRFALRMPELAVANAGERSSAGRQAAAAASVTAASIVASASTSEQLPALGVPVESSFVVAVRLAAAASSLDLAGYWCSGLATGLDRPLLGHQQIAAQSTAPGHTAVR